MYTENNIKATLYTIHNYNMTIQEATEYLDKCNINYCLYDNVGELISENDKDNNVYFSKPSEIMFFKCGSILEITFTNQK